MADAGLSADGVLCQRRSGLWLGKALRLEADKREVDCQSRAASRGSVTTAPIAVSRNDPTIP